jgi:hypothetical protein
MTSKNILRARLTIVLLVTLFVKPVFAACGGPPTSATGMGAVGAFTTGAYNGNPGDTVYDVTNHILAVCNGTSWVDLATSAGTAAGGSTAQLQYNNAGILGGTTGMTWDSTNDAMTLATIANPASSALTVTGGGLTGTTSYPALNITQTWNNAGGTFTGILENVTNTLSATGSKLLDLQNGGASKFAIDQLGNITANTGGATFGGNVHLASAAGLNWNSDTFLRASW